jgi:hypothetical protein
MGGGAERWLSSHSGPSAGGRYRDSVNLIASVEMEENRTPPSMRRSASGAADGGAAAAGAPPASPGRSEFAFRTGNERLYEAYNDLHSLAQDFEKPFDAPAILVVGHQTDGKSGEPGQRGWGRP